MSQGADSQYRIETHLSRMSGGLANTKYDEVDFAPDSSAPTTITYKLAGATVATLTLTYSGSNITTIVKS